MKETRVGVQDLTSLMFRSRWAGRIVGWAACLLAAGLGVQRAAAGPAGGWEVGYFDWVMHAAAGPSRVSGFLGVLEPGAGAGANIRVVWMQRGADGQAEMWGWQGLSREAALAAAVQWSSNRLGDPLLWSSDPEMWAQMGLNAASVEPQRVESGLFVGDALDPGVVDPSLLPVLVEALAAEGYEAAPTLSASSATAAGEVTELPEPVLSASALLSAVTRLAEVDLYGESAEETDVVASEYACWCPCTTVYSTTWAPASPASITYAGSLHCLYIGTQTCTKNCWGLHFWSCLACITSSVCGTTTVYGDLTCLPGTSCPLPGTPGFTPPSEYPSKPVWWP